MGHTTPVRHEEVIANDLCVKPSRQLGKAFEVILFERVLEGDYAPVLGEALVERDQVLS